MRLRAAEPSRGLAPAWLVILGGVVAALHLPKLIPALTVLQNELGLSLVQAGFLLSTVQLAGMALGLVIGLAADGLGLRRSMVAGLVILSLASALGALAQSAFSMLVLRVVEGLGFLLAVTPAPGLIRRLVPAERMGKMMGLWGAYMPFATAMALLLGPFVISGVGWQSLWLLLAGLSLMVAVWIGRAVPADASGAVGVVGGAGAGTGALAGAALPNGQNATWGRLRLTLTRRGPWLVALCFAVYSAQWLAVIGFLPSLYAQAGIALGASAGLTALAAAVNMIGNIASGRLLAAGHKAQHLLYTGYVVMALSALLAYSHWLPGLAPSTRFMLQYGAILMFSMVGGVIPGTLFATAVRLAPSEATVSTTIGWMQQWSATGQFFGPPLVALVASRVGGWQWTGVVTGTCALAGLLLARKVAKLLEREA